MHKIDDEDICEPVDETDEGDAEDSHDIIEGAGAASEPPPALTEHRTRLRTQHLLAGVSDADI